MCMCLNILTYVCMPAYIGHYVKRVSYYSEIKKSLKATGVEGPVSLKVLWAGKELCESKEERRLAWVK